MMIIQISKFNLIKMMLPILAVLSVAAPLQQQAQQPPAQVDWRTKGVTTPVMDQGQMGSAVAYSMAEYVFTHLSV